MSLLALRSRPFAPLSVSASYRERLSTSCTSPVFLFFFFDRRISVRFFLHPTVYVVDDFANDTRSVPYFFSVFSRGRTPFFVLKFSLFANRHINFSVFYTLLASSPFPPWFFALFRRPGLFSRLHVQKLFALIDFCRALIFLNFYSLLFFLAQLTILLLSGTPPF